MLYVIKSYDEKIILFKAVKVKEETEGEYILDDSIDIMGYDYTFPKNKLNIEFKYFFVTKNKNRLAQQSNRIYKNIDSNLRLKVSDYQNLIKRNTNNHEDILRRIDELSPKK